jgi:hypothetical protein
MRADKGDIQLVARRVFSRQHTARQDNQPGTGSCDTF